jgi:hypothetical protein
MPGFLFRLAFHCGHLSALKFVRIKGRSQSPGRSLGHGHDEAVGFMRTNLVSLMILSI